MQKVVLLVCLPCLVLKLLQVLISAKIKMAANMAAIKGVLNNFSHFRSARLFLFIFAYYIQYLLIYDIW